MIIASADGSDSTLEFQHTEDKAVLFVEARAGKKTVRILVTRTALAQALQGVGLYVTTLAEAEQALQDLTDKVIAQENDTRQAKLDAITSILERFKYDEEDDELAWASHAAMTEALQEMYRVLHPAPPYEFPAKPGAVVKAVHQRMHQQYHFFTQEGPAEEHRTWHSHRGGTYTEAEIRANWTDFETITEGIDE